MPHRDATRRLAGALAAGFAAVCVAALAAPILASSGHTDAAAALYGTLRHVCHQRTDRSVDIAGHPIALCERCFPMYVAMSFAATALAVWPQIRPPRLRELVMLGAPFVADVGFELIGMWQPIPLSRTTSGAGAGLAILWWALSLGRRVAVDR